MRDGNRPRLRNSFSSLLQSPRSLSWPVLERQCSGKGNHIDQSETLSILLSSRQTTISVLCREHDRQHVWMCVDDVRRCVCAVVPRESSHRDRMMDDAPTGASGDLSPTRSDIAGPRCKKFVRLYLLAQASGAESRLAMRENPGQPSAGLCIRRWFFHLNLL